MSIDRRRFLTVSAASVSPALLAACEANPQKAKKILSLVEASNEDLERGLFRHTAMNQPPASAKLAGQAFPKYYISKTPPVWNAATRGEWRLEVSGAVKQPLSLSLDQLTRLPRITQKVDHFCVEGWNARAEWTGVRVSDLAKMAGLTGDAHYVDFQSFDEGYHESWDMESAMHPQTLIAYGMDNRMIGPEHGAPARLHSPIKLGYKNTKYLTKKSRRGFWQCSCVTANSFSSTRAPRSSKI